MTTILSALVLLGILIFVHELGHFLFAKLVNVKVLKFSLGFGPRLVGTKRGDTEYLISAVPLGGYVKMLGEEPDSEISEEDKARAYSSQTVWKRFLIVASGPIFNLLFAAIVFAFIFASGVPVSYPDVGKVEDNSPASKAGLRTGDKIQEINGKQVRSWDEVEEAVDTSDGRELALKVKRDGEVVDVSVVPERKSESDIFGEKKKVWDIGVMPLIYPVVGQVMKGTPAAKAGLKKGDRILEIDGKVLQTWPDMTSVIHENPGRPLKFKVKRDGLITDMTITPEKNTIKMPGGQEKEVGLIGVRPEGNNFMKKFSPPAAIYRGIMKTWEWSKITLLSIVKLVERIIPAETIGGPILIFQMAGEQAAHGPLNFFNFMAVISINLGVLNFFPIPVLDGGHILFLAIEAVRGKPLSEKVMLAAQKAGLAVIVTLMVFAFYNDVMRLITGKMIP